MTIDKARVVAQDHMPSPLGDMVMAATDKGVAGLWFVTQEKHHPGEFAAPTNPRHPHLQAMRRWLEAYWRQGEADVAVPLDLHGTAFQRAVWLALLKVPSGETSTYGALAQAVNSPLAARAVGAAVGRNPVAILVPCHRIIGTNGTLTGYAGGLDRKRYLLELESRHAADLLRSD